MYIRVVCPRLGATCYLQFSTALLGTRVRNAGWIQSIASVTATLMFGVPYANNEIFMAERP